jgi:NAD(P)-dependent dehydrogenase (short-subunit alcohol dehydrogenase family)
MRQIQGREIAAGRSGTDSSDDDWRAALERNLVQTVRMMRLSLPHMRERPQAAVINIASISGWSPQLAMAGQYGAAKAAVEVKYLTWTEDGLLRQVVYEGLREDKPAGEVVRG